MKYAKSKPEDRTYDNIVFGSGAEMKRYIQLKTLLKAGLISQLRMQTKFVFIVDDVLVGSYKCDFQYLDQSNEIVIEDVKGWKKSKKTGKMLPRIDRDFRLRANLMKACFGLTVNIL